MHHVYTTPAFVVHSSPYGESGKFFLLFTRDFGMIGATAQGIRQSQSKLRSHLQDTHFSTVSVVRGKDMWRVTGAQRLPHPVCGQVHLKLLKLLKRLLHGEEKNEELFTVMEQLYTADIEPPDYDAAEYLTVIRVLNTLGYVQGNEDLKDILETTVLDAGLLARARTMKGRLVPVINTALKSSNL